MRRETPHESPNDGKGVHTYTGVTAKGSNTGANARRTLSQNNRNHRLSNMHCFQRRGQSFIHG